MHQVYIIYRAQFVQKTQEMGSESSAVKWFTEHTLPFEQLLGRTIARKDNIKGKEFFPEKIALAKKTLSNLKTLPV